MYPCSRSAGTIQLPPAYNPLELVERYEEICTFLGMTCGAMPPELDRSIDEPTMEQLDAHSVEALLRRDVEAVGCLIVELAVHSSLSGYSVDVGIHRHHEERLKRARELFCAHRDFIPSCLRSGIEAILRCGVHASAPSVSEPLHIPSIRHLRTFFFTFPKHIIDFHHQGLGLSIARGDARTPDQLRTLISELHFDSIGTPGRLLRVFMPAATQNQFTGAAFTALNSFPMEALPMLLSLLYRAPHSLCVIDSLRSGRLITFICALGGKEATEKYILPLLRHIFQPQSLQRLGTSVSALYSRYFLRLLLQTTSPRAFLTTILPLLALGLASISSTEGDVTAAPASEESDLDVPQDSSCHMTLSEKETFARWLHVAELSPAVRYFLETFLPPGGLHNGSLLWLASLLGPVACARRVVTTLLQSLAVCYRGPTQLAPCGGPLRTTLLNPCRPSIKSPLPMPVCMSGRPLAGDRAASASLRCLERVASLYGFRVILDLFLPAVCAAVTHAVNTTSRRAASTQEVGQWTVEAEARLISTLDRILHQCLMGAMTIAGRLDSTFPSGVVGRRALIYKIIDAVYVIGVLVGFENTRNQITDAFRLFFSLFDRTVVNPDSATAATTMTPQDPPRLERPILFSLSSEQDASDSPCSLLPRPLASNTDAQQSPEETMSSNISQNPVPPMFVVQLDRHTSALTVSAPKCVPSPGPHLQAPQMPCETIFPASVTSETSSVSSSTSLCEKAVGAVADDNQMPIPVKSNTGASLTALTYRSSAAFAEFRSVFTAELAHMAYIPFCRLAGGDHLDNSLDNIDIVRRLVNEHEAVLAATAVVGQSAASPYSFKATAPPTQQTSDETATSAPSWGSGKGERPKMAINSEYEARLVSCPYPIFSLVSSTLTGKQSSYSVRNSRRLTPVVGNPRPTREYLNMYVPGVAESASSLDIASISLAHSLPNTNGQTYTKFTNLTTKPANRRRQSDGSTMLSSPAFTVARPSISKSSATHLQGSWVDYFSSTMTGFPDLPVERLSFQGKRLISFTGHCGAVRCITALPLENSFVTCGQDRMVQLWSLSLARQLSCRSAPAAVDVASSSVDSRTQCAPRFLFAEHKRPVFAALYLPFPGLVASNDASLLLWDPVTGKKCRPCGGCLSCISVIMQAVASIETHFLLPRYSSSSSTPVVAGPPQSNTFKPVPFYSPAAIFPVCQRTSTPIVRNAESLKRKTSRVKYPIEQSEYTRRVTAFYSPTTAQNGGLDEIGLFSTASSGETCLPTPLSAMSTSPVFLSSLLCGDEAGHLLLVDPRSSPRSAIALRIFALAASSDSLLKFTSTGFTSQRLSSELTSAYLPITSTSTHLNEPLTGQYCFLSVMHILANLLTEPCLVNPATHRG
ncbi:unnamed protein product [Schistocephalus solidus]|uniref:WD_REPEATS_REGION domain-containing protein n=1 Tax=Schistocephalus solidus TaxID=70667 RepID=A0A183TAL3_SCHSO|nr:unnamed protein product [Schistocephalus solidus]